MTNINVSIANNMGTWRPRVATDPAGVDGYFVPGSTLGVATMTVTGTNRRGAQISGTLDIEVVAGAASVIIIEFLPVIDP